MGLSPCHDSAVFPNIWETRNFPKRDQKETTFCLKRRLKGDQFSAKRRPKYIYTFLLSFAEIKYSIICLKTPILYWNYGKLNFKQSEIFTKILTKNGMLCIVRQNSYKSCTPFSHLIENILHEKIYLSKMFFGRPFCWKGDQKGTNFGKRSPKET